MNTPKIRTPFVPQSPASLARPARRHNRLVPLPAVLPVLLVLSLLLSSCSLPTQRGLPTPEEPASPVTGSVGTPPPNIPQAEFTFRASLPPGSPEESEVYLTLVDEVTGLALNPLPYRMEPAGEEDPTGLYSLKLALPVGSVVKYRYERQAGGVRVAEHLSNGEPVRYRMLVVDGPGQVEDVISRWTDTPYQGAGGRIMGQAADSATGLPLPNLLVTAGGAQTLTAADGSFLLEGLPEGVHNLVAYSLDGAYDTFQQGARVAAESTTPASLGLVPATMVEVAFIVTLPENTPPVVPVRFAGNLYPLGAAFATLSGGLNGVANRMPVLEALPDGRYSLKLSLPAGADLRYKYTLGDGFWNAEHSAGGEFVVRQIIVPAEGGVIEDQVASWQTTQAEPVSFSLTVPASNPADETISIQFHPIFGWTEPLPLWKLGENRWGYLLYGPLNLPGDLGYRFCRNNQCGGEEGAIDLQGEQRSISIELPAWPDLPAPDEPAPTPVTAVPTRGADFVTGVALQPSYHPSWQAYLAPALQDVAEMGANWLVLPATWTFTRRDQLSLEPVPGQDPLWPDLIAGVETAQSAGLQVALYPQLRTASGTVEEFWAAAPRDFGWWLVWFERYRTFALHHARLAAESGVPTLILGGEGVSPALPGGLLADGTPSGAPADASVRWRALIAEIRELYPGALHWSIPAERMAAPPDFLDAVDGIYLAWNGAPEAAGLEAPDSAQAAGGVDASGAVEQAAALLDGVISPMQVLIDKPLVLAATFPAAGGPQAQAEAYNQLLSLVANRDWISGFVSEGYFFPAPHTAASASVNGLPAQGLLTAWFSGLHEGEE